MSFSYCLFNYANFIDSDIIGPKYVGPLNVTFDKEYLYNASIPSNPFASELLGSPDIGKQ